MYWYMYTHIPCTQMYTHANCTRIYKHLHPEYQLTTNFHAPALSKCTFPAPCTHRLDSIFFARLDSIFFAQSCLLCCLVMSFVFSNILCFVIYFVFRIFFLLFQGNWMHTSSPLMQQPTPWQTVGCFVLVTYFQFPGCACLNQESENRLHAKRSKQVACYKK